LSKASGGLLGAAPAKAKAKSAEPVKSAAAEPAKVTKSEEAGSLPFFGAKCGDWSDSTFTASSKAIHSPRYYRDYADFEKQLESFPGELGLKMFLTKEMYDKYKDQKTSLGVNFDKCIKGGLDMAFLGGDKWNVGKVGLLFGDADSVWMFSDLVDPIMKWRHGNPNLPHPPPNLDGSKLLDHSIIDDKYVISTRVRTGRSISGFPLSPCISKVQRRELEGLVTGALTRLSGDLQGDYYPLAGSNTYAPKPGGIDKDTEERLIKDHFLFQEPHDEPMLLSWRMERDWPHGRGIFHNAAKNALVWVNEEDHLRIMSMQKGYDIRAVFDRFAKMVQAVEAACKDADLGLIIDKNYGVICSCPSNCGTGLRASMMLKVPLASKQPSFKKWLADRNLQGRGSGGFASSAADDGIRDVSNCDRMGKDEVTLVNEMIAGVAELIKWEKELEAKK